MYFIKSQMYSFWFLFLFYMSFLCNWKENEICLYQDMVVADYLPVNVFTEFLLIVKFYRVFYKQVNANDYF